MSEERSTVEVVIPNGASVSNPFDCNSRGLIGFITPAAWTAAALNLEASVDNVTWLTVGLKDSSGSATGSYAAPAVASGYAVDPVTYLPYRWLRFRSGTLASPTNQGAARTFTVITRQLA